VTVREAVVLSGKGCEERSGMLGVVARVVWLQEGRMWQVRIVQRVVVVMKHLAWFIDGMVADRGRSLSVGHSCRTRVLEAVDGAASFSPIAVYGGLELAWRAELEFVALVGVEVLHVLGPERESGAGDGRGQVEALGDLAPQLFVDNLDEAALGHDEPIEFVEIEDVLGHDRYAVDGRAALLHEGEEFVEEVLAFEVIGQFVQLK